MKIKQTLAITLSMVIVMAASVANASNNCPNPTPGGACKPADLPTPDIKTGCQKQLCSGDANIGNCIGTGASKKCTSFQGSWSCAMTYYNTATAPDGSKYCDLNSQIPYDLAHPAALGGTCNEAKASTDDCGS